MEAFGLVPAADNREASAEDTAVLAAAACVAAAVAVAAELPAAGGGVTPAGEAAPLLPLLAAAMNATAAVAKNTFELMPPTAELVAALAPD